jgi:diguanylate cyclase (GGDEF)-like protein/PAS domain S-box-containing protein
MSPGRLAADEELAELVLACGGAELGAFITPGGLATVQVASTVSRCSEEALRLRLGLIAADGLPEDRTRFEDGLLVPVRDRTGALRGALLALGGGSGGLEPNSEARLVFLAELAGSFQEPEQQIFEPDSLAQQSSPDTGPPVLSHGGKGHPNSDKEADAHLLAPSSRGAARGDAVPAQHTDPEHTDPESGTDLDDIGRGAKSQVDRDEVGVVPETLYGQSSFRWPVELLPAGVLLCHPDGIVLAGTAKASELLGQPVGQLIGSPFDEILDRIVAEGGDLLEESGSSIAPGDHPVAVSLATHAELHDAYVGHRHRDGSRQWYRFDVVEVRPRRDADDALLLVSFSDVTMRFERLLATERRARETLVMLDGVADGIVLFSASGRILRANFAAARLLGTDPAELLGWSGYELLSRLDNGVRFVRPDGSIVTHSEMPYEQTRQTGVAASGVVLGLEPRRGEGATRWMQVSAEPVPQVGTELVYSQPLSSAPFPVVAFFGEITELKRQELAHAEEMAPVLAEQLFLQPLLDDLAEGILACDARGIITHCNATTRLFFGLRPEEAPIGQRPEGGRLFRSDGSPLDDDEHPLAVALTGERVVGWELVVAPQRGHERRVLANAKPIVGGDGVLLGAVLSLHDVTEQRRTETELTELALHDALTGCANRLLLSDRLSVAFDRATREGGWVGLLLLDMDDFKLVNDGYGHDVGDRLLIEVAHRLQGAVRPGDTCARLGGDEFVIVCPGIAAAAELERLAQRVEDRIAQPFDLGGLVLSVRASVGAALGGGEEGRGEDDPGELLRRADLAMYRVKADHREST